jgi:hypothetical protein
MRRYLTVAWILVALLLPVSGCTSTAAIGKTEPEKLLEKYGWSIVGDAKESTMELPTDFSFRLDHAPWRVWLDLSKSGGLDFSSQAGKTVMTLDYRLQDQKERLRDDGLQAILLVDTDNHVIGAWLSPIDGAGMGYSVEGKDLEHVTGLSWAQYLEKNSPKK